jgi:hypothetical protein
MLVPAPIDVPGRAMLLGPSEDPAPMWTGLIRMSRSWNRWVCRTQPLLMVTPSSRRIRSVSGSQCDSSQTHLPIFTPRVRAQTLNTGVPRNAPAKSGTPTTS